MRELALFAGAGGGILGGKLLGWRTVCAVEFASYPRSVLLARQRDGLLERFPIWDDVTTFNGKPWRGRVDVVSGGFPCQDISSAGKGAGLDGARSGLWSEMARIVGEVRPRFVFVENSPMLTSRGLGVVLGDLASLGFDAEWGVLGARDVGAPHRRDRIWILASHPDRKRGRSQQERKPWRKDSAVFGHDGTEKHVADPNRKRLQGAEHERRAVGLLSGSGDIRGKVADTSELFGHVCYHHGIDVCSETIPEPGDCGGSDGFGRDWWSSEPHVGRVAHGVASRVDRLAAIGNGQVPQCVALAWRVLLERLGAR